jgi:hypothetical protein
LHTRKSCCELDFTDTEAVPCVQSAIHVWVCHGAKELRMLGAKFGGRDGVEGDF